MQCSTHELCRRVLCYFGSLASMLIHSRQTFIATKLIKRQTPKSGTGGQYWKRRWGLVSFPIQHSPSAKRPEFEDDHSLSSNSNTGFRAISGCPEDWCRKLLRNVGAYIPTVFFRPYIVQGCHCLLICKHLWGWISNCIWISKTKWWRQQKTPVPIVD